MTNDASKVSEPDRYDIYMHSDDVQFLRRCQDGYYVRFSDYEALRDSHERLERALHKHGVHLKHCRHFNLKVPHSVCTCGLDAAFYPGSES